MTNFSRRVLLFTSKVRGMMRDQSPLNGRDGQRLAFFPIRVSVLQGGDIWSYVPSYSYRRPEQWSPNYSGSWVINVCCSTCIIEISCSKKGRHIGHMISLISLRRTVVIHGSTIVQYRPFLLPYHPKTMGILSKNLIALLCDGGYGLDFRHW